MSILKTARFHKKCVSAGQGLGLVNILAGKTTPWLLVPYAGLSDPYCKFKLGSQKYKSTTESKTLDPKWMQRFDLRVYDDCSILHIEVWDRDFPQNDDFIGL